MSGTADVGENDPDAENTADAAETVPVSDEAAEDPEYDSILQELNSSTPAPLDSSGENALDALLLEGNAENAPRPVPLMRRWISVPISLFLMWRMAT